MKRCIGHSHCNSLPFPFHNCGLVVVLSVPWTWRALLFTDEVEWTTTANYYWVHLILVGVILVWLILGARVLVVFDDTLFTPTVERAFRSDNVRRTRTVGRSSRSYQTTQVSLVRKTQVSLILWNARHLRTRRHMSRLHWTHKSLPALILLIATVQL